MCCFTFTGQFSPDFAHLSDAPLGSRGDLVVKFPIKQPAARARRVKRVKVAGGVPMPPILLLTQANASERHEQDAASSTHLMQPPLEGSLPPLAELPLMSLLRNVALPHVLMHTQRMHTVSSVSGAFASVTLRGICLMICPTGANGESAPLPRPSMAARQLMCTASAMLPQLEWRVIHMVGGIAEPLLADEEEAIGSASLVVLEAVQDRMEDEATRDAAVGGEKRAPADVSHTAKGPFLPTRGSHMSDPIICETPSPLDVTGCIFSEVRSHLSHCQFPILPRGRGERSFEATGEMQREMQREVLEDISDEILHERECEIPRGLLHKMQHTMRPPSLNTRWFGIVEFVCARSHRSRRRRLQCCAEACACAATRRSSLAG